MMRINRKFLLTLFIGFLVLASLPVLISKLKNNSNKTVSDIEIKSAPIEGSIPAESTETQHENDYMGGNFGEQAKKWETFLKSEVDWKKPIASQVDGYRANFGVPIIIWGEGEDSVTDYKLGPHPCGKIKTVFAGTLSDPGGKPFALGKALEVREQKIARSWLLPIDEVPLAVAGESILIDYPIASEGGSATLQMAIKTNGHFKIEEKKYNDTFNPEKYIECPPFESDSELRSDFTRCYEYEDLSTREKRLLVFEQPCT
ncbi:MAG: hypothetical protein SGJ18_11110 [Pseudomonadota bacterium]|nr:hypothetical protein [Pseudomonadota bacterium]